MKRLEFWLFLNIIALLLTAVYHLHVQHQLSIRLERLQDSIRREETPGLSPDSALMNHSKINDTL